jgi:hypothetical protein
MDINLEEKGSLVEALWHSVDGAVGDLANVPGLVHRVIETGAWRERVYRGKTWRNDSFLEFITSKPLKGCGWPPDRVEALIKDDPVILAEWTQATTGQHGGDRKSGKNKFDVINLDPKTGTSRAYLLGRLKRERPDLFYRVTRKELSTHAAAIEAGFRKKPSLLEQVLKSVPKLTDEEWEVVLNKRREMKLFPSSADKDCEPGDRRMRA